MDHPMDSSAEEPKLFTEVIAVLCLAKNIVEESHKLVDSLDKLSVSAASSSSNFKKKPVIIIVVGMAEISLCNLDGIKLQVGSVTAICFTCFLIRCIVKYFHPH
ncbi:hypothetical protein YC2023_008590 [Brassica napus]